MSQQNVGLYNDFGSHDLLLEDLLYMNTNELSIDEFFNDETNDIDLSLFADESFIFPDEVKENSYLSNMTTEELVNNLPRVHVPSNAKIILMKLGFNETKINALSAIMAYHLNIQPQNNIEKSLPSQDNFQSFELNLSYTELFNNGIEKSLKRQEQNNVLTNSYQCRKLKKIKLDNSLNKLTELAQTLQKKIHSLEMENTLLKNLVEESLN